MANKQEFHGLRRIFPKKESVLMNLVNRYFGNNVVVTLDTGKSHQGILEDVIDPEIFGYVKVSDGNEIYLIPEDQIVDIRPAALH
ncbi:hypothetical protein H8B09_19675 [Paenibacillus sp. PR3]|uniref:DUF2642 domain-containing protein n=1 Tax=Paenibacillus terricola TaxID=2763503 RepID=A0ABR8MZI3_9BACL|nr:hypothetical protein [Paenibacillus terricola]MBD3920995.1 hypothetical protein [Paenibacillus terricola]